MPNEVCHIEIVATDGAKAAEFYGGVFGWETSVDPASGYVMFKDGSGVGGGLTAPMYEGHTGTCIYIHVEDIEAMLKEIEAAGGETLIPKTRISEEHGFYALFKDLSGNVVGLWSKV